MPKSIETGGGESNHAGLRAVALPCAGQVLPGSMRAACSRAACSRAAYNRGVRLWDCRCLGLLGAVYRGVLRPMELVL